MDKTIKRVLIITLVFLFLFLLIIILFPIFKYRSSNYNMIFSTNKNIGNMLSDYYYETLSNENKFTIPIVNIENDKLKEFFINVIKNTENVYIPYSFSNNLISDKWEELDRPNFSKFWTIARPVINNSYKKSLDFKKVEYPVIHFRCGDIPFGRHSQYHIPKIKFIDWIIDKLKERNYKKVIWLNCTKHMSNDINNSTCDKINNIYIEHFNEKGIEIQTQCDTILEDFRTMVYSPLLISLNSSSYSFMAGISKDPNDYISCNMGIEENNKYKLQKGGDWIINNEIPLLHSEVNDYYNIEEIKNKIMDISK